jgi:hypothetical protein
MVGLTARETGEDARTDQADLPIQLLVLLAAVAAGVVAQGGYYLPGRLVVTALVAVAALIALWRHRMWPDGLWMIAAVAGALALWALLRTIPAGGIAQPGAEAAALGCVVGVLFVLGWSGAPEREFVAQLLVWVGVLVAVTAWLGVAWRIPRFAILVENRLWRGASTLTYPNAAAALLVPLALLGLGMLVARPRALSRTAAGFLVLVGIGATLSRAGFLALLAGFVALAVLAGIRRTIWRTLPVVMGAALAVVALMPSVPGANPPHSARALLGLLAGAVVALGPAPLPDRIRTGAVVVLLGSGLAAGAWLGHGRLAEVWSARANLDSSGRSGALRAALELIGQRPWTGTGVGRAAFLWPTPDGHGAVALYAHNEYVQMLVDLGVIGGVLLLILIVAVGGHLYRGRGPGHRPGVREGAVAGVTAFAVHSAFDFLWHIPVLLLAAGLLIGLAGPVPHSEVWVATQRGRA